jgi:hypothetical protein
MLFPLVMLYTAKGIEAFHGCHRWPAMGLAAAFVFLLVTSTATGGEGG